MVSTAFKAKIHTPSGDFTLGIDSPVNRDESYRNATRITRRSITYASGKTEIWNEVTTDPNLQRQLADRYGGMTDPEMVGLLAAMVQDIEQNLSTDVDRDWESFISKADLLSERFNERFGEGRNPIALARTMGLSNSSISHRPSVENGSEVLESAETPEKQGRASTGKRTRKGLSGITSHARRAARSAASIMEERYGLKCLMLGCVTLPPLTPEEAIRVHTRWPDLMRVFNQRVCRDLASRGLPADYLYVTEVQEKRYRKWGVVMLHAHNIFVGRLSEKDPWALTPAEYAAHWEAVLSLYVGRPVDCKSATKIECPRKSLKRELGKYLTKGGKLIEDIVKAGKSDYLPPSWWGGSKSVKDEEISRRLTLKGDVPRKLWQNLDRYQAAGLIWYRPVFIKMPDYVTGKERKVCVGVHGTFSHDWVLPALMEGKDPLEIAAMQHQGGGVSKSLPKVA